VVEDEGELISRRCRESGKQRDGGLGDRWSGGVTKTAKNRILTSWAALWQHQAMIGESENQFSLTRAVLISRGAQYQSNQ
jgi:hypothetical protein